jgi:glycerol-3-phosphate O-acyltransferase
MVEARKPAAASGSAVRLPDPAVADATSAMVPRFNVFFRWFAKRFFPYFDLDDATVHRLRALEEQGAVVYVMRYASRLDYFLFNTLFVREGLRERPVLLLLRPAVAWHRQLDPPPAPVG